MLGGAGVKAEKVDFSAAQKLGCLLLLLTRP